MTEQQMQELAIEVAKIMAPHQNPDPNYVRNLAERMCDCYQLAIQVFKNKVNG